MSNSRDEKRSGRRPEGSAHARNGSLGQTLKRTLTEFSEDELTDLEARAATLPVHNDLQAAARRLCPAIDDALAAVGATGADHTLVSGSGPTVFGLYRDLEHARTAAEAVGGVAAEPVAPAFAGVRPW